MAVKNKIKPVRPEKQPFYRIVVQDSEAPRNGKFLEIVGTYNPMVDPCEVTLQHDKVKLWLDRGAKPTTTVKSILAKNAAVAAAE